MKNNSFYRELVENEANTQKLASDNSAGLTKNMLDAFSTEEIEALAKELDVNFEKKSSGRSLQEKVAEERQVDRKKEQLKSDKASENKADGGQDYDDERDTHPSESKEDSKVKSERQKIIDNKAKENEVKVAEERQVDREAGQLARDHASYEKAEGGQGYDDERDTHPSEDAEQMKADTEQVDMVDNMALANEIKVASDYDESDLVKVAYALAEEKLASEGLSIEDYVLVKVGGNEKVASMICENAEKLAYVSEKSQLQVVDDILLSISDRLQG